MIIGVSSSQRTKGAKKTPATGGVPITGAKVGGKNHTWNFVWYEWY